MTFNDICPTVPGPLIPSDPIFIKLDTLKVMDIYKFQVSKFIFKCINKIAPVNFQNWFKINYERNGYNTIYTICKNYKLWTQTTKGPRIWNAMLTNKT